MLSWNLIIFYKFYIKVLNETDEFVIVLLQCNIPRNTHCDVKLLFLDFGSSLFLNKFYLGTGVSLDLTLMYSSNKNPRVDYYFAEFVFRRRCGVYHIAVRKSCTAVRQIQVQQTDSV